MTHQYPPPPDAFRCACLTDANGVERLCITHTLASGLNDVGEDLKIAIEHLDLHPMVRNELRRIKAKCESILQKAQVSK